MPKYSPLRTMNAEIKERWVKALRSGDYIQGKGALRRTEGGIHKYCCLGVLCDILAKETSHKWVKNDVLDTPYGDMLATQAGKDLYTPKDPNSKGYVSSSLPSTDIVEWAGFSKNHNWLINSAYYEETLYDINDRGGSTFSDIADLIEENY